MRAKTTGKPLLFLHCWQALLFGTQPLGRCITTQIRGLLTPISLEVHLFHPSRASQIFFIHWYGDQIGEALFYSPLDIYKTVLTGIKSSHLKFHRTKLCEHPQLRNGWTVSRYVICSCTKNMQLVSMPAEMCTNGVKHFLARLLRVSVLRSSH